MGTQDTTFHGYGDRWLLLFGGDEAGETWVWSEQSEWARVTLEGEAPPARRGTRAVWDASGGRFYLFGGEREGEVLQDLWTCRVVVAR